MESCIIQSNYLSGPVGHPYSVLAKIASVYGIAMADAPTASTALPSCLRTRTGGSDILKRNNIVHAYCSMMNDTLL